LSKHFKRCKRTDLTMYCLQSKSFENDIHKSWRELQSEKHLCDVTLACEDHQISAHKVILSACSPVFKNLLRQNPHQHPLLYLRGVKFSELTNMLDFMYQGEVTFPQDNLNEFLNVGQDLKIRGITDDDNDAEDKEEIKGDTDNELIMDKDEDSEQKIHISEPFTIIKYMDDDIVDTAPIGITKTTSEINSETPEHFMVEPSLLLSPTWNNSEPPEDQNSEDILNFNLLNVKAEPTEPIIEPMPVKFDIDDESNDECDMSDRGVVAQDDGDLRDVRHYYCEKCDYESVNRGDLRRHVAAKHNKPRYSCKQKNCKFKTAKKKLLKRHVDTVHKRLEMSCKQCTFTTNNREDLFKHMKSQHKDELVSHMRIQSAQSLRPPVIQLKPTNQNIFMSKAVQQFVEQRIIHQSKLIPTSSPVSSHKPGLERPKPGLERPKPGFELPKPGLERPKPVPERPKPVPELRHQPNKKLRRQSNETLTPTRTSTRIAKKLTETPPEPKEIPHNTPVITKTTSLTKIDKIEKALSNKQYGGGSDMKDKLQTLLGNISISIVKH